MGKKRPIARRHLGKQRKLPPSTSLPEEPKVGDIYGDAQKRTFLVEGVYRNDPDGREIRGSVSHPKQNTRDYSTTIEIWREVWRDKIEPQDPSGMRI